MVPYQRPVRLPLLPYERQLIEILGISREEYEQFAEQTWHASRIRPAGYEHIPDIRCDPVTTGALISLAIGLATTAVSYFLAPKPKPLSSSRSRSIELASVTGQDRFSPSIGFDSQQDIASYGSAIPLVFTKRSSDAAAGMLISPQLVWSRVLSRGAYQIVELQFIVGQGKLPLRSDWPAGKFGNLFLGNNTIDPGAVDDYAFFYRDGSGSDNRIGTEHLLSGQLMADVQPFLAPSRSGTSSRAFCSTFTPGNQVQFGVHSAIPNGTSLRLNWQVVALNLDPDIDDKDYSPLDIRKWISGIVKPSGSETTRSAMVDSGMNGTGANYSRRAGIWETSAATVVSRLRDAGGYDKAVVYQGDIGTTVSIVVGKGRQSLDLGKSFEDPDTSNQGEEICNSLENEHGAQDSALQVGEQFIIGTGLWQVVRRQQLDSPSSDDRDAYWRLEPDEDPAKRANSIALLVTLRCIRKLGGLALTGGLQPVIFGVPAQDVIAQSKNSYLGISENNGSAQLLDGKDYILDEAFFPICKAAIATFQNTRPCEATEIGIRSQVWLRYSGLCNFATIPSPGELKRAERKGTQYQTGSVTSYAKRVSLFSVDIRFAGSTADDEWTPIGETFAVVGSSPTDQFNYIRINNPLGKALEYRIRPRTSADAVYLNGPGWEVVLLDASRNDVYPWTREALGTTFRCQVNGRKVPIKSLWTSTEMGASTVSSKRAKTTTPNDIAFVNYQYRAGTGGSDFPTAQEISDAWRFMIAYRKFAGADLVSSPPMDITTGTGKEYYNKADPKNYPIGERITVREAYRPTSSNNIYINFVLQVAVVSSALRWVLVDVGVASAGPGWNVGDQFFKGLILGYEGATSTFRSPVLEGVFRVTSVTEETATVTEVFKRVFERYTALAEVSHYPGIIQRSCDNGPEHEVVYVNESLDDSPAAEYPRCAMAGLRLRSGRNFSRLDQFRMFATDGLQVQTLPADGSASTLASSNLFNEFANYLITNSETGAGVVASGLVDDAQMRRCTKFLTANKLHFNDVVTEPVNIRSYLGEIAPSMLCALVVRNGLFSVEPALPIEAGGEISVDRVPITAMFTSGNILEGSFSVEYLAAEERKDFTAVVRWRRSLENEFPQLRAYEASYSDVPEERRPIEEFDLRWVTSEHHAKLAANYFLAIRRRVTHMVRFKTTPLGSQLLPGSYIIVSTDSNPYTPLNNGVVLSDGQIISATPMTASATPVSIYFWQRGKTAVEEGEMVVEAGTAGGTFVTKAPRDVVFSVRSAGKRDNCYMVESVTLDEDGMAEIMASHFPLDDGGRSVIALEIMGKGGTSISGRAL
jgi:hypothetical protein